ncbi:hypothetical protein DRQ20_01645 [bacterium]|nr:MAG: hypothetical protein DRQ20_01645 [bacterium]
MNEKLWLLLEEWFRSPVPPLVRREIVSFSSFPSGMGVALVGVRRGGKTYALLEFAEELRKRFPLHNVVYVNFEDERLFPVKEDDLKDLVPLLHEYFEVRKNAPLWLLLDEVERVPGWERCVGGLIDRKVARVVFTGSSAGLEEIPSRLAGRVLFKRVYPLGFKEFLMFKNFSVSGEIKFAPPELLQLFREFLMFGGFPEVVLASGKREKREILSSYFITIFYRDVVEKFSIRKVTEFETFLRFLLREASSLLSMKKALNFMYGLGFKITKNTLLEYLNYAMKAFIMSGVEIFSYKLKDRMQYPKKIYCIDTGIVNLGYFRLKVNMGNLLENAVFLELKRREREVFYWKGERGEEVDFVVVENFTPVELIQVCYDVREEETGKREIRALIKAMKEFTLKEGLVITENYEKEETVEGKRIRFVPFWKWALR